MAGEGENTPGAPPNYVWPPSNWLDALPGAMPGVVPPPASEGATPPPNVDMSGVEPMYVGAQPPPVDMSGVEPMQVGNQAPPVATAEAAPNSPPDGAGVPPAVAAPASPDPQAAMYGVPMPMPPPPPSTDTAAPGAPPPDAQAAMYGVPSNKPPEPQLVGHELTTDEGEQDTTARALANMTPTQRALYYKQDEINRTNERLRLESEAQTADLDRANRNAADVIQAANDAKAKTDADIARADVLAKTKIDPQRGAGSWITRLILGAIGGFVSSMTGGRNLAVEQFNKNVADDIDAQKADIENGYKAINVRRSAVADEFARHQDIYRASETARLAANKAALTAIDTRMQDYHPGSAAAIALAKTRDQITANIAQQTALIGQQNYKNSIEGLKTAGQVTKDLADANLANANADKKRGAGVGTGAPNLQYTIATGIGDPFSKTPLMGRVKLGENGKELEGELKSYYDVQQGWANLAAIAARIDGHKSPEGQILDRFKTTDERDYKAIRAQLLATQLKAMGERVTEAAMQNEGDTVPDLQGILGAADTGTLIENAAQRSDSRMGAHLNIYQVNGDQIVRGAQAFRAGAPKPSADYELKAVTEGRIGAKTPSQKRDADVETDTVRARIEKEAGQDKEANAAVGFASTYVPVPLTPIDTSSMSAKDIADARVTNEARRAYNEALGQFHADAFKKKPDVKKVRQSAVEVQAAHAAMDSEAQRTSTRRDAEQFQTDVLKDPSTEILKRKIGDQ